jgi:hypothetical protein
MLKIKKITNYIWKTLSLFLWTCQGGRRRDCCFLHLFAWLWQFGHVMSTFGLSKKFCDRKYGHGRVKSVWNTKPFLVFGVEPRIEGWKQPGLRNAFGIWKKDFSFFLSFFLQLLSDKFILGHLLEISFSLPLIKFKLK